MERWPHTAVQDAGHTWNSPHLRLNHSGSLFGLQSNLKFEFWKMLVRNRDRWCLQATSGFRKPLNHDWLNFILRKMAITWHSFETLSRPSGPSHHGKCESLHCPRMPHTRSSQWPLRSCSPWLAAGSVVNASSSHVNFAEPRSCRLFLRHCDPPNNLDALDALTAWHSQCWTV